MKKLLPFILLICSLSAIAQDEGTIVKRERIQRDKNLFLGGGVSILGGSNLGDYSTGLNFEGGYSKRLNRVISIGGSISYLNFKYDPTFSTKPPAPGQNPGNWYFGTSVITGGLVGFYLNLNGGNVSLLSLSGSIKVNLIPIKDNSVVSIYGFAKPFVSMANLSSFTGSVEFYDYVGNNWVRNQGNDGSDTFESKSSVSGGIFVGPGIEFFPTKPVSLFLQASFGYTFPIDVVSTRSFPNDLATIQNADVNGYPFKSLGFTSINFAAGILFNLD